MIWADDTACRKASALIGRAIERRSDHQKQEDATHRGVSASAFEELNGALVLFGGGSGRERPQVPPLAGAGILLPGVKPVSATRQLSDHDRYARESSKLRTVVSKGPVPGHQDLQTGTAHQRQVRSSSLPGSGRPRSGSAD